MEYTLSRGISCPTCDYTIFGDEPTIEQVCNTCELTEKIASLPVAELWKLLDNLQAKEQQGNYTFSGIQQRIHFLQENK